MADVIVNESYEVDLGAKYDNSEYQVQRLKERFGDVVPGEDLSGKIDEVDTGIECDI